MSIEKQKTVKRFTKEIKFEIKCWQAKHDPYARDSVKRDRLRLGLNVELYMRLT